MSEQPLTLNVFIHEDLANHSRLGLYKTHFSWFADEIQKLSGRKISINMFTPSEAKALSDFDYKNVSSDHSLGGWIGKLINHLGPERLGGLHTKFNKYLLLTRDNINSDVAGVAQPGGFAAIASTRGDGTAAHEAGHMFGATHEDSEVLYNGWWSETIMNNDGFSPLRSEAKRFSDKNRENIRNYLDNWVPFFLELPPPEEEAD
ncbi:hypothetical protein ACKJSM_18030 [Pseudomonas sp. PHC1]|uniref:hypothetical protein n=1 Tax=Pseudomonas sp. PHC1 TaxID=3384759 RepID=UPI00396F4A80